MIIVVIINGNLRCFIMHFIDTLAFIVIIAQLSSLPPENVFILIHNIQPTFNGSFAKIKIKQTN